MPAGIQKSLLGFLEDKDKEEIEKTGEIIKEDVEKKKIKTKIHNQIETDYYEKSRIDSCSVALRKTFNVNIEIIPVRYGSKPPVNEKIYGYYMQITIKSGNRDNSDRDRIVEFIRDECGLKVY